ncbi:hypothetical protein ACIGB8_01710 [Promicromonospora sukumoe]|uniref:hypothetical protein n=1 Tax=Promicromonospora sukumoe TaxID=88382 RepID=UPI0037C90D60
MSRLRGALADRGARGARGVRGGRSARLAAGAALSLLLLAGCGSGGGIGGGYGGGGGQGGSGGSGGSSSSSDSSGSSGSGGGGGMTLKITSPDAGATVEVPFTVDLSSSVPLGPTDSGKHHVHVFFDGDDQQYLVVEGDSVQVTDLPAGEHEIDASLRNADHSAAGVETHIDVTVGSAGSGGSGSSGDSSTGGMEGDGGSY